MDEEEEYVGDVKGWYESFMAEELESQRVRDQGFKEIIVRLEYP